MEQIKNFKPIVKVRKLMIKTLFEKKKKKKSHRTVKIGLHVLCSLILIYTVSQKITVKLSSLVVKIKAHYRRPKVRRAQPCDNEEGSVCKLMGPP